MEMKEDRALNRYGIKLTLLFSKSNLSQLGLL